MKMAENQPNQMDVMGELTQAFADDLVIIFRYLKPILEEYRRNKDRKTIEVSSGILKNLEITLEKMPAWKYFSGIEKIIKLN